MRGSRGGQQGLLRKALLRSRGKCVLRYHDAIIIGCILRYEIRVKIGFPASRSRARRSRPPSERGSARTARAAPSPTCPDYCFFVQLSKTGRPVNKNLNAIKAKARSATLMSIIAVMALRKGLSRKP